jgi:hypothetical protein
MRESPGAVTEADEVRAEPAVPPWEQKPVTIREAYAVLFDEMREIEGFQRRLAERGLENATTPSPTAMRKAFVIQYATTILQIVAENQEEFDAMIEAKRRRQAAARRKRGANGDVVG